MGMPQPTFEHFDQKVADGMIKANNEAGGGIQAYLGVEFEELTAGRLVARLAVRKELLTPFGNLHGGVIAAFVDHCLGCVLYPLMERGQWAATTEFKLNYLAAVRGGTLVAESTVVSFTKRTAVVRVEVENDGRPACVAQGTLLVVDRGS
jgi:1,4-dihydroxy-2-naphthoyl-CoA hydrolase